LTTFYKNYVALCARKKKSASAVAVEIGLSRTSPNGWKKGKQPSDINLEKLANYFGVSVDDLISEQKEKPTLQAESELDPVTQELFEIVNNSDEDELKALLEMARLIKKRRIE
jgi:transcriptional regulator with XRE-family HTH domain